MKATLLIDRVRDGSIDAGGFGHREHLEAAWELLRARPFLEAVACYGNAIDAFATRAGAGGKYSVTVTLAFLSLIAERLADDESTSFDAFLAANDDLARASLAAWYSQERLSDPLARRVFLMPDRAP